MVKALSLWFLKKRRDLPWRKDHDPYRIWVSEIMLQQTQVATVIDYYERFLKRFPTLSSLAESTEQEVLTLWSGLGYYRRAKNLRLGAQYLITKGGHIPKTRPEMLEVPGIGPYTAGAILSIAFDLPEALVDGNVQRVFARYFGIKSPIQTSVAQKLFWEKASEWVKKARSPRVHNQALMELGALICHKGMPLCDQCPISKNCVAFKKGLQKKLPVSKPRKQTLELHWVGIIFHQKKTQGPDLYFVKQNLNTPWWEGLWDFPSIEKPLSNSWETAPQLLHAKIGQELLLKPLNHVQHSVTHHNIRIAPFLINTKKELLGIKGKWLSLPAIAELPLSSLAKKIFRQLPLW